MMSSGDDQWAHCVRGVTDRPNTWGASGDSGEMVPIIRDEIRRKGWDLHSLWKKVSDLVDKVLV